MKIKLTYKRLQGETAFVVEEIGDDFTIVSVKVAQRFARRYLDSYAGNREVCLVIVGMAIMASTQPGNNEVQFFGGDIYAEVGY